MNKAKEYFMLAKEQLEQQRQNIDMLNAKVNTLLLIGGVLMVFIGEFASRAKHILDGILLGAGMPVILFAMIILLIAYRVVDWGQGPNVDRILYDLKNKTDINSFYVIGTESIAEWYRENEITEQKKTRRINIAGKLIMWGMFINIICVVIYLF